MNIYESSNGYNAKYRTTLVPQKHVTVERIEGGTVISVRRFGVGEIVEYGSYNLAYMGTITNITTKCVIVKTDLRGETKRMKPGEFAWRNWDFSASAAQAKNSETSHYI